MSSASTTSGSGQANVRSALLNKISQDKELLSIGSTVSKVIRISSENDEALHDLAYLVLSDVALTQKILRLANTVFYRPASSGRVTTVSRAIFLLGFDIVKTSALTMVLVDGLANKDHARSVRAELLNAVCASVMGREMARNSPYHISEEAAIAALFKNLGRVLLAQHDHAAYNEIMALAGSGICTLEQAALRVMDCTFELLTETVLNSWKIPETIAHATRSLPAGILKQPATRQEWTQQIASFSAEAAPLIQQKNGAGNTDAIAVLHARFGESLSLSQDRIRSLLKTAVPEVTALASSAGLKAETDQPEPVVSEPKPAPAVKAPELPADLLLFAQADSRQAPDARHSDGKPVNARERLFNGIQDVTQMMASSRCKVNELMLLVLETLYGSMGFRFATLCLKDHKSGQFRARVSLGEKQAERQAGFSFCAADDRDIFNMAMKNDVDLMISDAAADNIIELIPRWHRELLPDARSFIVLSFVVDKVPIGFYYADRAHVTPNGIPPDEIALIKILKGQVLSMLQRK